MQLKVIKVHLFAGCYLISEFKNGFTFHIILSLSISVESEASALIVQSCSVRASASPKTQEKTVFITIDTKINHCRDT